MSTRVLDRVDDWDQVSFDGGYAGLHALAEDGFSGVVRAGAVEVFMANGAVVGVEHGTIEDVEGSDGTAYAAPHEGLPLLGAMQSRSDEVKAKYYSEDTPISEVDRTLSGGGFSGYIELSENVLSGDYYIVYHGGESLSAAFVGASSRLITDDEAFETADDEVGIFEVRPVDIEPVEIPEPSGAAAAAGAAGGAASAEDDDAEAESDATDASAETTEASPGDTERSTGSTESATARDEPTDDETASATGATAGAEADAGGGATTERTQPSNTADAAAESTSSRTSEGDRASEPDTGSESAETGEADASAQAGGTTAERTGESATSTAAASDAPPEGGRGASAESEARPTPEEPEAETSTYSAGDAGRADRANAGGSSDPADLETRAIPSLDPGRTVTPEPAQPDTAGSQVSQAGSTSAQNEGGSQAPAGGPSQGETQPQTGGRSRAEGEAESSGAGAEAEQADASGSSAGDQQTAEAGGEAAGGRVADLEAELDEREAEIDRLEAEVADAEAEAQELAAELEQVREERDELREERDRLAAELDRLEEEYGEAVHADTRLTGMEALDQTNLFVRYDSKGKATLDGAADGEFSREQVANNIRLEYHTQFDQSAVAVGGESYDTFLEKTLEFRFVDWVIHELLFEIRDTGAADALVDLYEALPKIDRAELHGSVSVTFTSEGQEKTAEESYDVILRDRMGNPLVVANLNDSREAATETMMTGLLQSAEHVGLSEETFVSAFIVTESFFEPAALEVAADATRSGILSRDKRRSYVNLSRKNGYHLCLVEARDRNFHLAVPEL